MKAGLFAALIPLAACTATPAPAPAERADAAGLALAAPAPDGGAAAAEREFERVRGEEAARRVRSASQSVMAVFHQGLPKPITLPDDRVAYAGPSLNAVMLEDGRWLGWKTGRPEPVPADVAERLESILADPALWGEPDDFPRGSCTDAGSLQLAIRRDGRLKSSRQDNCDSRGLAGKLGRIVLDERLEP
ncbi:MAG TPA: hypothetical protein VF718_00350 [Allosphingosinicella sp.]|jgi:hypothetical protein